MANWLSSIAHWSYSVLTHDAVAVGLGGALGANARYWVSRWLAQHPWSMHFPLATVLINVSGCFLLGLVSVVLIEKFATPQRFWLLLLGTGFCGGYTTFSTFGFETIHLVQHGKWHFALLNVLGSVLAGLAAVILAFLLLRGSIEKLQTAVTSKDTTVAECGDTQNGAG